jgi:hypothetical protein
MAVFAAGCGGGGKSGSTMTANTAVVLLASSTGNDQLTAFP